MLLDRIEAWYERIGKKIMYGAIVVVCIYIFFKYILGLLLPFIIAWGLACLLNPFVTALKKYAKIPRGLGTLVSMLTILSGLIGGLTLLVRQLWLQAQSFAHAFPTYRSEVEAAIDNIEYQMQLIGEKIPLPEAFNSLDDLVREVMTYIGGFLDDIVKGTYNVVTQVPTGFFFVIVVLIATFFMTKDHRKIKNFVKAQIPKKAMNKMVLMQSGLKSALGGYVKTQLILMCFTFCICLVGLLVLGRPYALLIALGIAMLDALPVFGSGAVLIPWGIFYFITGEYILGIGMLAIYGIILVMRQIMEPKVLSTQIGVYALVTLMAMYIGLRTMGVIGMILGPVIVVMLKTLQRVGVLPEFKKPPEDE